MKKNRLIIAAMEKECLHLADLLGMKKTDCNVYENSDTALIVSGIGKVNAAIACQRGIDLFQPDVIFNYGFAGSVSRNCQVGDFVCPRAVLQHDFIDLSPEGFVPYVVSGQERSTFELCGYDEMKNYFPNLKECEFLLSGDRFVTEKMKDFDDAVCDMEGYSIARDAYIYNIPVIIIKFITDSVYKEKNDYFDSVGIYQKKMQTAIAEYILGEKND